MLNQSILLGRLTKDLELKTTTSGKLVTSFDLAVNVPGQDRNAPPDYIPIVCWEKLADFATKYLSKGRQIVVVGRIKTRKWTDENGKNRKAVEIVASNIYFADSKGGEESATTETPPAYAESNDGFEMVDLGSMEGLPF